MEPTNSRFSSCRIVAIVFACILATAGCVPKSSPPDLAKKYQWEGDEVIESYTPRDDGIPLSPAELSAFQSAGQLDKGVSQEDRATVELHFKYFVHEHRGTMQRFIERTARYLPYMKKIFRDRGLPEDLVYLSIVESGGNPNAISRAGAVGLWQFMPFTGKKYGLNQNSWIDERRDPFKATYAASDYLLKLYGDFSDWHLAVAAYNAGEGKIGRALEGTGANGFFELCRLDGQLVTKAQLREETRQYVPRLLAVVKIMRHLETLGFTGPSKDAAYDLAPVSVPPGTNLSAMARNLGLTWDEFLIMNPAFRRTASPPTSSSTAYVIPDQRAKAEEWLTSTEARSYAGWREYTVQKRDTLAAIAKKHKVSSAAILQANGMASLPKPGNTIVIPGKSDNVEPIFSAPPERVSATGPGVGKYLVQSGDTLATLARDWGTDVQSIRTVNKMGSVPLTAGQRIIVPGNSKNPPSEFSLGRGAGNASSTGSSYIVKPGDTVFSIAKSCNTSVQALCEVNGIDTKVKLKKGRVLQLPGVSGKTPAVSPSGKPGAAAPAPPLVSRTTALAQTGATAQTAKGGSVVVQKGDTLFSIAKSKNISVDALQRANNLKPGSALRVGQSLRLP